MSETPEIIVNITRRKFVREGIVTTIVAGATIRFGGNAYAERKGGVAVESKNTGLVAYYDKAAFAAYVDSDFLVHAGGENHKYLRLVKVEDFPLKDPSRPNDECFRLAFTAPRGTNLAQRTYAVEHAALGAFALFIVPIGIRAGVVEHYEAVFNRRFAGYVGPTVAPRLGADPAKRNKKRAAVELENRRLVSEPESRMEGSARPARRQKMMDW